GHTLTDLRRRGSCHRSTQEKCYALRLVKYEGPDIFVAKQRTPVPSLGGRRAAPRVGWGEDRWSLDAEREGRLFQREADETRAPSCILPVPAEITADPRFAVVAAGFQRVVLDTLLGIGSGKSERLLIPAAIGFSAFTIDATSCSWVFTSTTPVTVSPRAS